jgi:hypothetical protein
VFVFGGVAPEDILKGYIVLLVTAIGFGSVGMFFSSVQRTQPATVSRTVVFAATMGALFIWVLGMIGAHPARADRPRRGAIFAPTQPPSTSLLQPVHRPGGRHLQHWPGYGSYCSIVGSVPTSRSSVPAWSSRRAGPGAGHRGRGAGRRLNDPPPSRNRSGPARHVLAEERRRLAHPSTVLIRSVGQRLPTRG